MKDWKEKDLLLNPSSMASSWIKSLQCKSRAFDDVVHHTTHPKHLLPTASCRNSFQSLKDIIENPKSKPIKPKHLKTDPDSHPHKQTRRPPRLPTRSESVKCKPDPEANTPVRRTLSAPINPAPDLPFFPSVSDLSEGHPSRNVVEIIFQTRWGPKPFSGLIEMVFKIQNPARDVARFEEYRDSVKLRAGSGNGGRCSADGNEMMRFRCLGAAAPGGGDICCGGVKGSSVCTYSGSGRAHESAGGGRGRRAMLVCRVIAGRVTKRAGLDESKDESVGREFDSAKGDDGELVVFDSRAVLPCFLVIYKL